LKECPLGKKIIIIIITYIYIYTVYLYSGYGKYSDHFDVNVKVGLLLRNIGLQR